MDLVGTKVYLKSNNTSREGVASQHMTTVKS